MYTASSGFVDKVVCSLGSAVVVRDPLCRQAQKSAAWKSFVTIVKVMGMMVTMRVIWNFGGCRSCLAVHVSLH